MCEQPTLDSQFSMASRRFRQESAHLLLPVRSDPEQMKLDLDFLDGFDLTLDLTTGLTIDLKQIVDEKMG